MPCSRHSPALRASKQSRIQEHRNVYIRRSKVFLFDMLVNFRSVTMPVGHFCEATDETCIRVTRHSNLCIFNSIFPPSSSPVAICAIRLSIRRHQELNNCLSMILGRESISTRYFVTYLNFMITRFFLDNYLMSFFCDDCPQQGFHLNEFCVKERIISQLWSGVRFSFLQLNFSLYYFISKTYLII